jgi:hypothetical protein
LFLAVQLTLSPELQHRWTNFYASGREILAYLQRVAAKYKLERFLRFGHKLTAAQWKEKTSQWHLSFDIVDDKDNKVGEKEAVVDAVIQGMGGLSRWDWPKIPGIKEFKVRSERSLLETTTADALATAGQASPLGGVRDHGRGREGQDCRCDRLGASRCRCDAFSEV